MDYSLLYFIEADWNLIVEQTNLYAQQKKGPDGKSVWYPVTVDEFKAWVADSQHGNCAKTNSTSLMKKNINYPNYILPIHNVQRQVFADNALSAL